MTDTLCPTKLAEGAVPGRRRGPRAALAVAMLGFFVVALDAQIVNVALPTIGADLGGSLTGLQWVVTGYTLAFSALLLFAGTFSDRVGARSAYRVGMVVFVVASAACALAPSLPLLVGARVAQGVGAALVTPASLALIREAYADEARRARAIAYWALGGSVAAAAGPVLGGLIVQASWRWIFLVNLPVGAVALAVLRRVEISPRRERPFDWAGQGAALLFLAAVMVVVSERGQLGWSSPEIVAASVVAAVAGVVFLRAQRRGAHPMVPLDLFQSPQVSLALTVAFLGMVGFYGVVFLQGLYFQQQRGATALQAGLLFLPMTALVAALNPLVPRLAARYGRPATIIGGQLLLLSGLLALVAAPADAPILLVAVFMIPVGVGGSFTVPPLTSMLLDAVPEHRAGTASGVLNTAQQTGGGGALGVAAFGAVVAHQADFGAGLRISFLTTAALLVATSIGTYLATRQVRA